MSRRTVHPKRPSLGLQSLRVARPPPTIFDDAQCPSPTSSESSVDEDDVNRRMTPYWPQYQDLFCSRGFQLDRVRDVKEFYQLHDVKVPSNPAPMFMNKLKFQSDEDALCPDAGLPENLFRGSRIYDRKKIVVKAVHIHSREYNINRLLSIPPLKYDPMNHTIPILDLIEVHEDQLAFIIMEEWSSQLVVSDCPCCVPLFLSSLRQCIEHAVFLHKHNIAHLDISLKNLLTDYKGNYAYTDYELSRRFDDTASPRVYGYRGTEVPPDCENGASADPYKIDVWALGVLILRACKVVSHLSPLSNSTFGDLESQLTGHNIPEILQLVKPMLNEQPEERPSMDEVLQTFEALAAVILSKINRS